LVARDSAAFDDRSHRSERKHAAAMNGNDHLFASLSIAPFLMAPGLTCQAEPMPLQDRHNLICCQSRDSALTQS
jgi:hypothetical protein